jgi:hypothetical protein
MTVAIADAVANGDTKKKLGTHTLKYTIETIVLQDTLSFHQNT